MDVESHSQHVFFEDFPGHIMAAVFPVWLLADPDFSKASKAGRVPAAHAAAVCFFCPVPRHRRIALETFLVFIRDGDDSVCAGALCGCFSCRMSIRLAVYADGAAGLCDIAFCLWPGLLVGCRQIFHAQRTGYEKT